jgi:hypothetical protein
LAPWNNNRNIWALGSIDGWVIEEHPLLLFLLPSADFFVDKPLHNLSAPAVPLPRRMYYFTFGRRRRNFFLWINHCIIYQPWRFILKGTFSISLLAAARGKMCFCGGTGWGLIKLPIGMVPMWLLGHPQPLGLESKRKQGLKVVECILRFE